MPIRLDVYPSRPVLDQNDNLLHIEEAILAGVQGSKRECDRDNDLRTSRVSRALRARVRRHRGVVIDCQFYGHLSMLQACIFTRPSKLISQAHRTRQHPDG